MRLIAATLGALAMAGTVGGWGGGLGSGTVGGRGGYCDPATGCTGGTSFYGHTSRTLYVVDVGGGSPQVTPVGDFGVEITDIARTPADTLVGVSFDALFAIDTRTARATRVGSLGVRNVNGLVAVGRRLLASSTDGVLYEVDARTGRASRVGAFGGGVTSSGDLCLGPGGAIYMTAPAPPRQPGPDRLARVDPRSGAAAVVGSTGLGRIYGLAWADGALLGLAESGAVVRLDPATGAGRVVGQGGVPFWGGS